MSTGVFGYGLAEYPEQLQYVRFKEPMSHGEVELSEKAWLVKREIAEKMVRPEPEVEEAETEEAEEKEEKVEEEKPKHRHIRITIDASDAKIHDIFRGVIKPLKDEGADVKVTVSVEADGEISDQTLKMKVKETLKQLGAEFEVEEE